MLERRAILTGLAALPMVGLPIAAMAAPAAVDPYTVYHGTILALHEAINFGDGSEDDKDSLMDRWGEIDAQAMAGQPSTLAGALGALEMARREFHQFHVEVHEDLGGEVNPGDWLILHLLDGAIGVLRQATGGGVA